MTARSLTYGVGTIYGHTNMKGGECSHSMEQKKVKVHVKIVTGSEGEEEEVKCDT